MTLARPPEAKASAKDVFINHERKSEVRRRSDTALVLTVNDNNHQFVSRTNTRCCACDVGPSQHSLWRVWPSMCFVDGRHEQLPHTR